MNENTPIDAWYNVRKAMFGIPRSDIASTEWKAENTQVYAEMCRMFGIDSWRELAKIEDPKIVHTMQALAGPHGETIYKVMKAQQDGRSFQ